MALLVGIILGIVVWIFGRLVGLDRDRAYYATILAVVAFVLCPVCGHGWFR